MVRRSPRDVARAATKSWFAHLVCAGKVACPYASSKASPGSRKPLSSGMSDIRPQTAPEAQVLSVAD